MHEKGVTDRLIKEICAIAEKEKANTIVKVSVRLGALSHMSPSHFKEHFDIASRGTIAEHAVIVTEESDDIHDPHASAVVLKSIDVK